MSENDAKIPDRWALLLTSHRETGVLLDILEMANPKPGTRFLRDELVRRTREIKRLWLWWDDVVNQNQEALPPLIPGLDFANIEERIIAKLQAEHTEMLDYLKREFARDGVTTTWDLIHKIDPAWPNPWKDPDDPEGKCTCFPTGPVKNDCPIHGDEVE